LYHKYFNHYGEGERGPTEGEEERPSGEEIGRDLMLCRLTTGGGFKRGRGRELKLTVQQTFDFCTYHTDS